MIMKSIVKTIALMALMIISANAMEIKNLAQAVNEAGRQRMLTQRMLKDYAMIGLGNTFGDPQKDLEKDLHILLNLI
jgi:nitrate/nitrite-specific signal transduction histidine kinase